MKAAEVIAALSPSGLAGSGSTENLVPFILAFFGGPELKPARRRRRRQPPSDAQEILAVLEKASRQRRRKGSEFPDNDYRT